MRFFWLLGLLFPFLFASCGGYENIDPPYLSYDRSQGYYYFSAQTTFSHLSTEWLNLVRADVNKLSPFKVVYQVSGHVVHSQNSTDIYFDSERILPIFGANIRLDRTLQFFGEGQKSSVPLNLTGTIDIYSTKSEFNDADQLVLTYPQKPHFSIPRYCPSNGQFYTSSGVTIVCAKISAYSGPWGFVPITAVVDIRQQNDSNLYGKSLLSFSIPKPPCRLVPPIYPPGTSPKTTPIVDRRIITFPGCQLD